MSVFKQIDTPFGNIGLWHMPTVNPLPNGKWPLIVAWHGKDVNNLQDVASQGIIKAVEGMGAATGTMPDGKTKVNFAIISILGGGGWPPNSDLTLPTLSLVEALAPGKIDYGYNNATGLSAGGGQALWNCQNAATSKQFATMLPLSTNGAPNTPAEVQQIVNNGIISMVGVGANDTQYEPISKNLFNILNQAKPGIATFFTWPGAHDSWDLVYSTPSYKVFDFMLANPKAGTVQPVPTTPPTATKKLLHTITTKFYDDNSTETIVT